MPKRKTILVADDSRDDTCLLKRAFIKAGLNVPLVFVPDGKSVVDYLSGTGMYADRSTHPFPRLVLLDVNMPGMDGFGVLRWVKERPETKRLTVTMYSNSVREEDIHRAYDLGANSYLIKPASFEKLQSLARQIHDYWLETNVPPTSSLAA